MAASVHATKRQQQLIALRATLMAQEEVITQVVRRLGVKHELLLGPKLKNMHTDMQVFLKLTDGDVEI
jgi:hypothetical protein